MKITNIVHNFFRQMFLWNIKMIYYDRIDVSEGIDVNKTSASKEWCLSLLVFVKL